MALAPLERDEFLLYYQPKFKSRTGSLCGAEALIRWHDRAEGLVPPGFFIPMLEESVACGHAQDRIVRSSAT